MLKLLFVACLTAAALIGCTSITPAGLRAAMQLDPLETPPAALSFAVSVPNTVQLSDGDAVLSLGFVPDRSEAAQPVWAKVPLALVEDANAPAASSARDRVYVLTLGVVAAREMAAAQRQIKELKASEIDGKGTLTVGVEGGCLSAPLEGGFPVATWLRPDPEAQFVPLTRRTDFFEVLDASGAQALRARLRPC